MNYLTELLAFYRWMGEHRLTPLLQAYWHLLMYYNNKAAILAEDGHWYWPVTFRVANSVVGQALGLKDRFKINHQRKHLVKHSRIDYIPHTGQEAGDYRLIPFDPGLAQIWVRAEKSGDRTMVWTQTRTGGAPESAPFINTVNHKPSSLYGSTHGGGGDNIMGFNLLPPLTDEEKAAVRAEYPDNDVARFNAEWALREKKGGLV